MTQELGRLAEGRIMLALEGGYNLVSLSQACEMCIRSLLGEQVTTEIFQQGWIHRGCGPWGGGGGPDPSWGVPGGGNFYKNV